MARKLLLQSGKFAIWDGETDDLPFTDPIGNISRVKFHSDLPYIKTLYRRVETLNLPSRSNFQMTTASYTLFAHGQSGYPLVLGSVPVNGVEVGFSGSVPVQMGYVVGSVTPGFYGRWLALGADDTNVYIHEYTVARWSSASHEIYDALSLPITVYVTDRILE